MAEFGQEFEQIYTSYFNDVFLYLKKLSKNESIALELTSDTFFKAMHAIDSFRGACDIRVWLCQIAKHCYLSYLKKQQHTVNVEDFEHMADQDNA